MAPTPPWVLAIRVVVAWLALSATGLAVGDEAFRFITPLIELEVDVLQSDFLGFVSVQEHLIRMSCDALRAIPLGGNALIPPYASFDGGAAPVLHALVPFVLFGVVLAARPAAGLREWCLRTLFGLVASPLLLLATTALNLVGGVYLAFVDHGRNAGEAASDPLIVQLYLFMELGGRWVLPLVLGAICVLLAARRGRPGGKRNRFKRSRDGSRLIEPSHA